MRNYKTLIKLPIFNEDNLESFECTNCGIIYKNSFMDSSKITTQVSDIDDCMNCYYEDGGKDLTI